MEDPKVLFADTTARRAELMKATERFKTSIQTSVESLKDDAAETGKTVALVAAVAIGVFIIANAILPKSDDDNDSYASYDEYDDDDDVETKNPYKKSKHQLVREKEKTAQKSAIGGMIGGLLTSVLTNIAREQLSGAITRFRNTNAINSGESPSQTEQYEHNAPAQPAYYTPQL